MEQILIDRPQYTSRIYSRLFASRPQSISIIGDWQLGKSSILQLLSDESSCNQYQFNHMNPIFILFDLKESKADWQTFLSSIYAKLAQYSNTKQDVTQVDSDIYQALQKLVVELQEKYAICLLIDNFELLTQNPETPLEFFSYLRSLANTYRLAYITTSRASLQSLCVSSDICESPFFNIFTNLELKNLSVDEGKTLLNAYNITDKTELAFEITGGHTGLFMKWILWFVHNQDVGHDQIQSQFFDSVEWYCQEWFAQFSPDYQEVLTKLAKQEKIPSDKQYLMESLKRKGYLTIANTISARAFYNYLLQQESKPKAGLFARLFKK